MAKYGRKAHLKALFFPWWIVVNAIWALVCSADVLVSHFGSEGLRNAWNSLWIAPKWGWRTWIWGVVDITFAILSENSFRLVRAAKEKEDKTAGDLQKALENLPRPKVFLDRIVPDKI